MQLVRTSGIWTQLIVHVGLDLDFSFLITCATDLEPDGKPFIFMSATHEFCAAAFLLFSEPLSNTEVKMLLKWLFMKNISLIFGGILNPSQLLIMSHTLTYGHEL